MEKKKKYLLIIGIFIVLLSVVGVTYAYWTINLQQTGENDLTSSCFKVELLDENNPITLEKAFPILDSDAESLFPYTFTLKNECEAIAKYQINLEILEDTTLDSQYVKYMLNEVDETKEGKFLTDPVEPTITEPKMATDAYKLKTGYLESKEEKHYELRIYLDGKITAENKEVMNQSFLSKISITASYAKEKPKTLEETILALEKKEDGSGDAGLYKVEHTNANITYTKDPLYIQRLQATEYRYAGKDPNNYVDVGEKYTADTYGIFRQEEHVLYSEEKCNADRNLSLNFFTTNVEVTACSATSNTEGLYFLEYKYSEDDEDSYIETFKDSETCQEYKSYETYIVQECTSPQTIYSYTMYYQDDSTEYSSNEECLSDANKYGYDPGIMCKKTHEVGEPIYWRIIGLVNTPEGQRVKLIRDESIGDFSWDTSDSEVNEGNGVNEWSQSDLMKLLNPGYENNKDQICTMDREVYEWICNGETELINNSLYWNGEKGKCYIDQNNTATECDFTNIKMPDTLKKMVESVTWNTGSNGSDESDEYIKVDKFYNLERSSNTGDLCKSSSGGDSCNDNVGRTISWKGKVGLMYPSDYGYATSGEKDSEDNRMSCLEQPFYGWNYGDDCYSNDWLLPIAWSWTLSPGAYSDESTGIFLISSDGSGTYSASNSGGIRPSVYLKSDVFVKQGDGSKSNAYILEV